MMDENIMQAEAEAEMPKDQVYVGEKDENEWGLERAVYSFSLCFFLFTFYLGSLFFIAGFYWIRNLAALYALYLCWIYYDSCTPDSGGRKWESVRKWKIWNKRRDYFNAKLVKTAEIPPDRTYMFVGCPHGIAIYGAMINLMTDATDFHKAFPGLKVYGATLRINVSLPISRELQLAYGMVSASEKSILHVLNGPRGNVLGIIPGGAAEMNLCKPGTNRVLLKRRKGFVKLALKSGSSLVPFFTFNETCTFEAYNGWLWNLHRKLQDKFHVDLWFFKLPFFRGRSIFSENASGIYPHAVPITTVVGKPMHLPKVEEPTKELINEYHGKFMDEMERLFHNYKEKYDIYGKEATLVME